MNFYGRTQTRLKWTLQCPRRTSLEKHLKADERSRGTPSADTVNGEQLSLLHFAFHCSCLLRVHTFDVRHVTWGGRNEH